MVEGGQGQGEGRRGVFCRGGKRERGEEGREKGKGRGGKGKKGVLLGRG